MVTGEKRLGYNGWHKYPLAPNKVDQLLGPKTVNINLELILEFQIRIWANKLTFTKQ